MVIKIYDHKKGREVVVGQYDEKTKEFCRKVADAHFMRMYGGYGIQEEVVNFLLARGCKRTTFDTPNGKLTCAFSAWLERDIKSVDLGHGKQRFMPISRMKLVGDDKQKSFW